MTKAKEAIAIWRNDPLLVIRIYYDLRNGVVAKGIRDGEFLPATVCFADPQGSCGSIIGYPQIKLTVKGKACHLITLWIEEGRLNRGILLENGKRDIGPEAAHKVGWLGTPAGRMPALPERGRTFAALRMTKVR